MKRFEEPILVTRPLLPDLERVNHKMKEIWDSQWLTNNGAQHKKLTLELKNYLHADNFVLFSNGTLALLIGLKALDLTGEVITTPFTFPATVEALDWNGLTPVFCDIGEDLNIDPDQIESLITEKTSAILAVHVFGNHCQVHKIEAIARKHHLKVIYDGAHAFGSTINGVPVSTFGDMTMFSFHATKLFNTVEGGGLAFKDPKLEEVLCLLKNFGINSPESVVLSGVNAKMNEVQAGIGLEVLKIVGEERAKRQRVMETYIEGLKDINGIQVLTTNHTESSSFQYFTIKVDEALFGLSRDALHEVLKDYNVFTRKYFYPLCSDFTWYKDLESARPEHLPKAQKAIRQVLSMPFYGDLPLESVKALCEIIKEIGSK